jgi:hypothetical protein
MLSMEKDKFKQETGYSTEYVSKLVRANKEQAANKVLEDKLALRKAENSKTEEEKKAEADKKAEETKNTVVKEINLE